MLMIPGESERDGERSDEKVRRKKEANR